MHRHQSLPLAEAGAHIRDTIDTGAPPRTMNRTCTRWPRRRSPTTPVHRTWSDVIRIMISLGSLSRGPGWIVPNQKLMLTWTWHTAECRTLTLPSDLQSFHSRLPRQRRRSQIQHFSHPCSMFQYRHQNLWFCSIVRCSMLGSNDDASLPV